MSIKISETIKRLYLQEKEMENHWQRGHNTIPRLYLPEDDMCGERYLAELIQLDYGDEFEEMSVPLQKRIVHLAMSKIFSRTASKVPLALSLARLVQRASEWPMSKNAQASGVKEAILDVFGECMMTKATREKLKQLGNKDLIMVPNLSGAHIDQVVMGNNGSVGHYNR